MMKLIFLITIALFATTAYAEKTCDQTLNAFLEQEFVESAPHDNPGSYRIMFSQSIDLLEEPLVLKTLIVLAGNRQEGAPRNTHWHSVQLLCTTDGFVWYLSKPELKVLTKYRGG